MILNHILTLPSREVTIKKIDTRLKSNYWMVIVRFLSRLDNLCEYLLGFEISSEGFTRLLLVTKVKPHRYSHKLNGYMKRCLLAPSWSTWETVNNNNCNNLRTILCILQYRVHKDITTETSTSWSPAYREVCPRVWKRPYKVGEIVIIFSTMPCRP